jgi:predicted acetyltransferase
MLEFAYKEEQNQQIELLEVKKANSIKLEVVSITCNSKKNIPSSKLIKKNNMIGVRYI